MLIYIEKQVKTDYVTGELLFSRELTEIRQNTAYTVTLQLPKAFRRVSGKEAISEGFFIGAGAREDRSIKCRLEVSTAFAVDTSGEKRDIPFERVTVPPYGWTSVSPTVGVFIPSRFQDKEVKVTFLLSRCLQATSVELVVVGYFKGDHKSRLVEKEACREIAFLPISVSLLGFVLIGIGIVLEIRSR
jgi:hypothetical protein